MVIVTERKLLNALQFWTAGEVNSKEGCTIPEWFLLPQTKCSEVGAPQVELDGAVVEALVLNPDRQCRRTKLILDVRIDNPFLY